jgi:hypothetical protein
MPTYDYCCAANGRIVEVRHGMDDRLLTWGDLCARAGVAPGDTPVNSPVERLITGGSVVHSATLKDHGMPPCQANGSCGTCAFD